MCLAAAAFDFEPKIVTEFLKLVWTSAEIRFR